MVRAHGNWCGPNWTAGKRKAAQDLDEEDRLVPAVDAIDQACKNHDIAIAEGDPDANKDFYKDMKGLGVTASMMSAAVALAGPSTQSYLRGKDKMVRGKERKSMKHGDVTQERRGRVRKEKPVPVHRLSGDERYMAELPPVPDDDDLMEETPESTQPSQFNFSPDAEPVLGHTLESARRALFGEMTDNGDVSMEPEAQAAREAPAGMGMMMQKVQPIYRSPELNVFTEVRTVRLPVTFYLSMNKLNHAVGVPLKIRMNMPYDILKDNTLQQQVTNSTRARGLSNDYALKRKYSQQENGPHLYPFPTTVRGATPAVPASASSSGTVPASNLIPANREFYFRNWTAWTPLSTDYKITILNAAESINDLQHCKVFSTFEQYTASSGFEDTVPTAQPLSDVMNYPFMTQHTIEPRNVNTSSSDYVLMKGTWTPTSVRKLNVFNDQDIKIWNPTGGLAGPIPEMNPLVQEQLTILAYKHELFPVAPRTDQELEFFRTQNQTGGPSNWTDATTRSLNFEKFVQGTTHINLKIDLSYVVQVRDLRRPLRYPNADDSNDILMRQDDLKQTPRNREIIGNGNPTDL